MIWLIIIYLISVLASWITTRAFLIKFSYERAEFSDVIVVLFPIMNIFATIDYLDLLEWKINMGWFFGIKKVK